MKLYVRSTSICLKKSKTIYYHKIKFSKSEIKNNMQNNERTIIAKKRRTCESFLKKLITCFLINN